MWPVSARVSWRETPSFGREGRGFVDFGVYLHEYIGASATPSCGREGRGFVACGVYLREYLGARRLLADAKAVELWYLACICTSILARDAIMWARNQWSCCNRCVSSRASAREGRGVMAFRMNLHEHLSARRRLASAGAVELFHCACVSA